MTIYKSRQVNLDPEPYVNPLTGRRRAEPGPIGIQMPGGVYDVGFRLLYDPRPEFDATRDPEPWVLYQSNGSEIRMPSFYDFAPIRKATFEPRREQFDTPVNPILVAFRKFGPEFFGGIDGWLKHAMHGTHADGVPVTPEQIDHARKVLTRILGVYSNVR